MSTSVRETMWESMTNSPFLMIGLNAYPEHREPMTAQLDEDADSMFWFYTTKQNRIVSGGPAMAQFVGKDHKVFASISGSLAQETDPAVIDKYWSKKVAAWYQGGREDANLCMMRFQLSDAEVWTVDPDLSGRFKLLTGKTVDPEQMGNHRKLAL